MQIALDFPSFSAILPPTPAHFFSTLVETIGEIVGWKTGVFAPCDEAVARTLRKNGIDPNAVEDSGSHEAGWFLGNDRCGLRGAIVEAFLNGTEQRNLFPFMAQGPDRGLWGLTGNGLRFARPEEVRKENVTASFIDSRIRNTGGCEGQFMRGLKSAVAYKLQMSATVGIVEDHVQTCLMRLIRRDSLRERIFSGFPVSDSQIASYAVRSAFNDCRDSGTEPVARSLYGARTERERGREVNIYSPVETKIVWRLPGDEGPQEFPDFEIVDSRTTGAAEKMGFEAFWARIERVVQQRAPASRQTLLSVIQKKADGLTIPEIAASEGISSAKAADMLVLAKDCIRRAARGAVREGMLDWGASNFKGQPFPD